MGRRIVAGQAGTDRRPIWQWQQVGRSAAGNHPCMVVREARRHGAHVFPAGQRVRDIGQRPAGHLAPGRCPHREPLVTEHRRGDERSCRAWGNGGEGPVLRAGCPPHGHGSQAQATHHVGVPGDASADDRLGLARRHREVGELAYGTPRRAIPRCRAQAGASTRMPHTAPLSTRLDRGLQSAECGRQAFHERRRAPGMLDGVCHARVWSSTALVGYRSVLGD